MEETIRVPGEIISQETFEPFLRKNIEFTADFKDLKEIYSEGDRIYRDEFGGGRCDIVPGDLPGDLCAYVVCQGKKIISISGADADIAIGVAARPGFKGAWVKYYGGRYLELAEDPKTWRLSLQKGVEENPTVSISLQFEKQAEQKPQQATVQQAKQAMDSSAIVAGVVVGIFLSLLIAIAIGSAVRPSVGVLFFICMVIVSIAVFASLKK